jgi:hypothetical protein
MNWAKPGEMVALAPSTVQFRYVLYINTVEGDYRILTKASTRSRQDTFIQLEG